MLIKFFMKDVRDETASAKQGHPVFEQQEWIHIIVDDRNELERQVTEKDRTRTDFLPYYQAFKAGLEPPTVGLPLKEWPLITRTEIELLNRHHVRSVEDLSSAPDNIIQRCGATYKGLRARAQSYLKESQNKGITIEEILGLKRELSHLEIRNQSLVTQVNSLVQLLRQNSIDADHLLIEEALPEEENFSEVSDAGIPGASSLLADDGGEIPEEVSPRKRPRSRKKPRAAPPKKATSPKKPKAEVQSSVPITDTETDAEAKARRARERRQKRKA